MHTGRTDEVIMLAEAGGSWRVRVGCVGRAAAAALSEGEGTVTVWSATSCSSGRRAARGAAPAGRASGQVTILTMKPSYNPSMMRFLA